MLVTSNEISEVISSKIQSLHRQSQILRAARDLLLPRLISGKIEERITSRKSPNHLR
jgi:hypothetical protein